MAGYKCPFCKQIMSLNNYTLKNHYLTFESAISHNQAVNNGDPYLRVSFYKCPNDSCQKISIYVSGDNKEEFVEIEERICPKFRGEIMPSYVPASIRQDYEEACSIVELSPKASATLSRRCLQGMIRDYWGITRKTLHQEIEAIKGQINIKLYDTLLAFKSIGNIGAHPEDDINLIIDVEPEEALSLVKMVEYLIEAWYTERENTEALLSSISEISDKKKADRASNGQ